MEAATQAKYDKAKEGIDAIAKARSLGGDDAAIAAAEAFVDGVAQDGGKGSAAGVVAPRQQM